MNLNKPVEEVTAGVASQRALDVFLRYLRAEGVQHVFGVPGGLLHPLFDALDRRADFTLVCAKHEEGAAFMADGYARVSGRLAVCAATAGPGATNLLTGVAVAHCDGVPMLVVTGHPQTSALGRGAAQEGCREDMDIVDMFRPVTKYSTMVTSAPHLAMHLRRALRLALSGRPGPVHLSVPIDIWAQPVTEDWFDPTTYRTATRTFDRRAVQQAAALLLDAEHPVIVAGSGTRLSGAIPHLRALAELIPCRVATSPRGKGIFPEDHALSLGVLGYAGHETARDTIFGDEVDVLMTVGCALDEPTTLSWRADFMPSRALIQLDVDGEQVGRNYPVTVPLIGDAQTILVELIYHLHRRIRDGTPPRSCWPVAPAIPAHGTDEGEPGVTGGVTPQRWREEFNAVMPEDAIVFSDVGGHMLFNIKHLRFRNEQQFELNMGFASMGHGTCAAIGAALALPDRRVFSVIGDGCFCMNGMELLTAVEYDIPVIWVVENNNMHGITWHGSRLVGEGRPLDCVRLAKPLQVAAIAHAMGVATWVVREAVEVAPALRAAMSCKGPALIEILVDPSVAPPLVDRARAVDGGRS